MTRKYCKYYLPIMALAVCLFHVSESIALPSPPVQQTASIAIDDFPAAFPLQGDSVPAKIIRSLIAQPLFTVNAEGKIKNILIDALRQDFKTNALSVRLRKGARFSNGAPVRISDIRASLTLCFAKGGEGELIRPTSHATLLSETDTDIWVDFPPVDTASYAKMLTKIQSCPILQGANVVLFGPEYGLGSNFISAGEFYIANFKHGVNYTLNRTDIFPEKTGVQQLEIFKTDDARRTLSMLRSGSVDALVTNDPETIVSAKQDSTLQILQCFEKTLIKRSKFSFVCSNVYDLSNVGYAA